MRKWVLGWATLGMGLLVSFAAILLFATDISGERSALLSPLPLGNLLLLAVGATVMIAGIIFLLKLHFEE